MRLFLREHWQNELSSKIKIYSFDIKNRKIIDDTFDRLQIQKRLKFINVTTSFSYSVFVVWTIKDEIRKKRIIVNIKELNKLIVSNVYSVLSQIKIIFDFLNCFHLSVLNANAFFYQWRIHSQDIYKQTMITHREQETFLISIMSCRNSMIYVQRQMNLLLRIFWNFVKIYIDDIIVWFKSFQDHLRHLRLLFQLFQFKDIFISSNKIFLEYVSVLLLNRRMNFLELITSKERLKAIASLTFFDILIALEKYFEMTNYLKKYVYFFVDVFRSLQDLKTRLLKNSSEENKRKKFTNRTRIILTDQKMISFLLLQKNLTKSTILIHFDKIK